SSLSLVPLSEGGEKQRIAAFESESLIGRERVTNINFGVLPEIVLWLAEREVDILSLLELLYIGFRPRIAMKLILERPVKFPRSYAAVAGGVIESNELDHLVGLIRQVGLKRIPGHLDVAELRSSCLAEEIVL